VTVGKNAALRQAFPSHSTRNCLLIPDPVSPVAIPVAFGVPAWWQSPYGFDTRRRSPERLAVFERLAGDSDTWTETLHSIGGASVEGPKCRRHWAFDRGVEGMLLERNAMGSEL
jgi:hypothetical protein